MPQPFKRKGRNVRMSPTVILEEPAFATLIALVATHWNKLEQSLGIMYTWLLMGQEPSAFELYHELVDLKLKKTAFMVAAKGKLPADLIKEIDRFYGEVRRLSARRAKVVHGTWCRIDTKPASLLLADPRDMNAKINELLRYVRLAQIDKSNLEARRQFPIMPDEYQEYHARDFQALMNDLVAADLKAGELGNKVLARALELYQK
jgi:hypothetical protein